MIESVSAWKTIFGDLAQKGIHFTRHGRKVDTVAPSDQLSLQASIPSQRIRNLPVDTKEDLHALHAFYCSGATSQLQHAPLAAALQLIESKGNVIYRTLKQNPDYCKTSDTHYVWRKGERIERLGKYGAYKTLQSTRPPLLLAGTCEDWSARLASEQDAIACAYFMYDGSSQGLSHPQRAENLRTLGAQGHGFSEDRGDWDPTRQRGLSARDAWTAMEDGAASINLDMSVSADHHGNAYSSGRHLYLEFPVRLSEQRLSDFGKLQRELDDLGALYEKDDLLQSMVDQSYEQEAEVLLGAAGVQLGSLNVEQRWGVLLGLLDEFGTPNDYMQGPLHTRDDMEFLRDHREAGEDEMGAVDDFKQLRRDLGGEDGRKAFDYVRHEVKCAEHQSQFRKLVGQIKNFPESCEAFQMVRSDESDAAFPVMSRLLDVERDYCQQEAASRPQEPTHQLVNGVLLQTSEIVRENPFPRRAMQSYALISQHRLPGQTRGETMQTLTSLHQTLLRHEGWQASCDTFVYLQQGSAEGRFCGRSSQQALADLLQSYMGHGNLALARDGLLSPPPQPLQHSGSVERTDDNLVVGGVRVPVRQ